MWHGLPKRPGPKYDFSQRRVLNHGISGMPEVLAHYRADAVWSDSAKTTRPNTGDTILVVEDLSRNGHDCVGDAAYPSLNAVTDYSFPAIEVLSTSTHRSSNYQVKTAQSFPAQAQVIAFRSPSDTWSWHGAVCGRAVNLSNNGFRPYLFPSGAYGHFDHASRIPLLRSRGYPSPNSSEAWPDSCAIFDITRPCVATIGHHNPGAVYPWEIGATSDLERYVCSLLIYEIVLLSTMDQEIIKWIEQVLMERYFV
jgi:hypothetical protein